MLSFSRRQRSPLPVRRGHGLFLSRKGLSRRRSLLSVGALLLLGFRHQSRLTVVRQASARRSVEAGSAGGVAESAEAGSATGAAETRREKRTAEIALQGEIGVREKSGSETPEGLAEGMSVFGKYMGGGDWLPGVIVKVHPDNTCDMSLGCHMEFARLCGLVPSSTKVPRICVKSLSEFPPGCRTFSS